MICESGVTGRNFVRPSSFSSDGTRRKAEVRLRLAGRPPPVILLDVLTRVVPTTVTVRLEAEAAKAVLAG